MLHLDRQLSVDGVASQCIIFPGTLGGGLHLFFYAPNFEKVEGVYCFRLVPVRVHVSVQKK